MMTTIAFTNFYPLFLRIFYRAFVSKGYGENWNSLYFLCRIYVLFQFAFILGRMCMGPRNAL